MIGARALVGLTVVVVAAAVLWVVNCSGPRPEAEVVRVVPPAEAGWPYLVEARLRNASHGHGQVTVTFRLRDTATGQTFQEERKVELREGETAGVVAEIHAPPGDYAPELEAEYPPR